MLCSTTNGPPHNRCQRRSAGAALSHNRPSYERVAQASAASSRSLPQNNSSPMVKEGAPNRPREPASAVCVFNASLVSAALACDKRSLGIDAEPAEYCTKRLLVADVLLLGIVRDKHGTAESRRPALPLTDQCEPRRLQPILRELHRRQLERQPFRLTDALKIAPHIAAFRGIDVERRVVPPIGLEDRPEQERPPAHLDMRRFGQPLDAHGGRVGIGAAEFVPEVERRHGPRKNQVATAARRRRWRAFRTISSSICRLDRAPLVLNEKIAVVIASPPSPSGARSST